MDEKQLLTAIAELPEEKSSQQDAKIDGKFARQKEEVVGEMIEIMDDKLARRKTAVIGEAREIIRDNNASIGALAEQALESAEGERHRAGHQGQPL